MLGPPVASWFETPIVAKFTQATYICLRNALLTRGTETAMRLEASS
jgi:hypothetical protein